LYPNPTNGSIYLDFGLSESSGVRVFNATGMQVAVRVIRNQYRPEIDLDKLAPGVYTIIVDHEKGRSVGRIVLMR